MLIDLEKNRSLNETDADICIIGAGAVGLPLAVKMSRLGRSVVLLEGGGSVLERQSQDLFQGTSSGHPFKHISVGRYRALGGTTHFWGGQVVPLDPIVFGSRPWISTAAWPFDRETLEPYFLEAYRMLLLGQAEFDDDRVWRKVATELPDLGSELEFVLTRWTPKRNFARLFEREVDRTPSLKVITHSNVVGFSLDNSRRHIQSVHARTIDGHQLKVRARHIVAACGTIEISRLLKLPTIDHGSAPWQSNPWLGRAFMDHLDSIAGKVTIIDHKRFHNLFDNIYADGFKYYPKLKLTSRAQIENQFVDIAAQFLFDTKFSAHLDNIKLFVRSIVDGKTPENLSRMPAHVLAVAKIAAPLAFRYIVSHRSFKPNDAAVRLALYSEQIPNRESEIRLGQSVDRLGLPKVDVNWKLDGRELRTFAAFARHIQTALKAENLADVEIDPELLDEDPSFLRKTGDAIHTMSGARIGCSSSEGVVDEHLKVYGTENLYIAGAAVFPTTGFANPTLTAIALGLRLADRLQECLASA